MTKDHNRSRKKWWGTLFAAVAAFLLGFGLGSGPADKPDGDDETEAPRA